MKTKLSIIERDFYINGNKTYCELENLKNHGLLMNARFIQGIFDDKANIERFNRFGKEFNVNENTDELIKALPEWYEYGLRAFTIGLQGGGPCFTVTNDTIDNQPFLNHGKVIDEAYLERLDKLIMAADAIGMVAIVSLFYPGQAERFVDGLEIENAVRSGCLYLKEKAYTNIILEICNEYDLVRNHDLIGTGQGMASLIRLAQRELPGVPVGCSLMGGNINEEVCKASDVVIFHGNGLSRGHYYNLIKQAKEYAPNKPIVCNEDSQAIGNMAVSMKEHVSWGYYNNMTKQEPPVYWGITRGEDEYFANRMALELGILKEPTMEEGTYFQGLEAHMTVDGKRWLRLASLYPEKIDYVEFYYKGELYETAYDEPFSVNYLYNWKQYEVQDMDVDQWSAMIYRTE